MNVWFEVPETQDLDAVILSFTESAESAARNIIGCECYKHMSYTAVNLFIYLNNQNDYWNI